MFPYLPAQFSFPIGFKIKRRLHVDIPTVSDKQKTSFLLNYALNGLHEVAHQNNIAVHIAEEITTAQLLGLFEQVAHQRGAKAVPNNVGNMPQAELGSGIRYPLLISQ